MEEHLRPMLGGGLHGRQAWYARHKQAVALGSLACCCLLLFVATGSKPLVVKERTSDVQAAGGSHAATAKAADDEGALPAAAKGTETAVGGGRVAVGFFGESLCLDCQHMVRDVLAPMFENGIAELMDLTYHAFGNAKNASGGGFSYQHGPSEGKYNRYILCAQHFHPKQHDWFPYVRCFADNMRDLDSKADSCAQGLGWEAADISSCAKGDKGAELEQAAAEATWALRPKHNFVPWMTVNGVAVGADFESLYLYVCAAAPASKRPDACYTLPQRLQYMG